MLLASKWGRVAPPHPLPMEWTCIFVSYGVDVYICLSWSGRVSLPLIEITCIFASHGDHLYLCLSYRRGGVASTGIQ